VVLVRRVVEQYSVHVDHDQSPGNVCEYYNAQKTQFKLGPTSLYFGDMSLTITKDKTKTIASG